MAILKAFIVKVFSRSCNTTFHTLEALLQVTGPLTVSCTLDMFIEGLGLLFRVTQILFREAGILYVETTKSQGVRCGL